MSGISIPARGRRKSAFCHWIEEWTQTGCYCLGADLEQIEGEKMLVDLARLEADGGGRRSVGMDHNGQGAYHRLVYCRMFLPLSATSNGCGQR
ncbi:hypothetical protein GOBAR_AA01268 [Gossypium barbadense]|uniref:Uncharacterized protein n=1 Tax=Gossypium barbadense TaxID=3634 RepID=A0A2P5YUR7_GOSBA|nr:hypothetical protein GOBAR_AA01268 [Gossypium barbadense]